MTFLLLLAVLGLTYWNFQLSERIQQLEELDIEGRSQKSDLEEEGAVESNEDSQNDEDFNDFFDDKVDDSKWPEHLKKQRQQTPEKVYKTDSSVDRSQWPAHLSSNTTAAEKTTFKTTSIKSQPFEWEQFLGQRLFPILGSASIVLAIVFFTVWAIANGWIGPVGQLALGLLVSFGLLGLGEYLRTTHPDFYQYLSAAGLAGVILCTLVARHHYELISPFLALSGLVLQTALGLFLSLRYNARVIGNFAILSGLIAPFVTGLEFNAGLMLPYLLVMTSGSFVLGVHKKWPEIFSILLLFATGYLFIAIGAEKLAVLGLQVSSSLAPILLLGYTFLIYGLVGSAGIVRLTLNYKQKEPPSEESYELIIFTLTLFLANLCASSIFLIHQLDHFGFLLIAQAIGIFGLSQWFNHRQWPQFGTLTLGLSITMALLATLWELRDMGSVILPLVLAAEAVILTAIGRSTRNHIYTWFGQGTLLLSYLALAASQADWIESGIATGILILGSGYSCWRSQSFLEKIWLGLMLFITTTALFVWCFSISQLAPTVNVAIPLIWTLGLGALSLKPEYRWFGRAGLLLCCILFAAQNLHWITEGAVILTLIVTSVAPALTSKKDEFDQAWTGSVVLLSTLAIFYWCFSVSQLIEPLNVAISLAWTLALGALSLKSEYRIFAGCGLLLCWILFASQNLHWITEGVVILTLVSTSLIPPLLAKDDDITQVWIPSALFFSTLAIFYWCFSICQLPELLKPLFAAGWIIGLAFYNAPKPSLIFSAASLLMFLLFWLQVEALDLTKWDRLIGWLWMFLVGTCLYILLPPKPSFDETVAKVERYSIPALVTLAWATQVAKNLEEPLATVSLLAWACLLLAMGFIQSQRIELRHIGMAVILLVVAKLYLIDVWGWSTGIRFGAFLALGLALLGVGFFYQKLWQKK